MRVLLYDTMFEREAAAELFPLTDVHAERVSATWLGEFHRRLGSRERDDDFLMWKRGGTLVDLSAEHGSGAGYVIALAGDVQGLVILQNRSEPSRMREGARLIKVCYLATAPWNRRSRQGCGRYRGAGTALVARAVGYSVAAGCDGRLGLHSLAGSDEFYRKLGFCDLGADAARRGLRYFELTDSQATRLLATTPPQPGDWPSGGSSTGPEIGAIDVSIVPIRPAREGIPMNTQREAGPANDQRGISSASVLVSRLLWFLIGPAALLVTTFGIVTAGSGWLTVLDAAFVVIVALMIWGRWKEQRSGRATLTTGDPATWEHFRRYVRALVGVALGIWVTANVVGNHVLSSAS